MQFSRVITPIEDIQIWSASGDGFSFVISYESRGGAGLQGNPGFVASWRPIYQNHFAGRTTKYRASRVAKAILPRQEPAHSYPFSRD